jgi:hypothetical protein
MAYTLQALIAKQGTFRRDSIEGANVIILDAGFEMVPFTCVFLKAHRLPFLPLADEGTEQLPQALEKICLALSRNGNSAYVEAEYFGGTGTQASVVFRNGRIELGPLVSESAINQAVAALGALKGSSHDEFEALGLGKYRETDGWLSLSGV